MKVHPGCYIVGALQLTHDVHRMRATELGALQAHRKEHVPRGRVILDPTSDPTSI